MFCSCHQTVTNEDLTCFFTLSDPKSDDKGADDPLIET